MKTLKYYQINEGDDAFIDNKSGEIFDKEWYSPAQFLRKVKKNSEITSVSKSSNGLKAVLTLSKSLKTMPLEINVHREGLFQGGVPSISIRIKGYKGYDQPFSYNSGNSTKAPTYKFGKHFDGLFTDEHKPLDYRHTLGSYKAIQNHAGVLKDIVDVFKAYKVEHKKAFSVKDANSLLALRKTQTAQWKTVEKAISNQYDEMRGLSRRLGIRMRAPKFDNGQVTWIIDEPREFRHPSEYANGGEDVINNTEYSTWEDLYSKIQKRIEKFTDKHNMRFDIHA